MKCKSTFFLILSIISTYSYSNFTDIKSSGPDISNQSGTFVDSYKAILQHGENFNNTMYIFDYSCGGGAICANIYDPKLNTFIDFPDSYILEHEDKEIQLSYSLNSRKICITGYSAYDLSFYDNKCYLYSDGNLLETTHTDNN